MATPAYIACLDVGTTLIKCCIINTSAEVIGFAQCPVKMLYPEPGLYEINPDDLWESVVSVIKETISVANLTSKDITCLGISTQRSTFITWRRDNGKAFHNFITWKDVRAETKCKELNSSAKINTVRWGAYSLYLVTNNPRYLTGSRLKIAQNHVTGKLLWTIENIPNLREAIAQNNAMFGTVDTWLIYKFSNKQLHVTDITNASATAFFDPFVLEWGSWAKKILKIPEAILPQVVDNDFDFGTTHEEIFGASIPIKSVMADQSASMVGCCCFQANDLKVTMGTGAFLDVNTGNKIHTGVTGLYPLVGWKIKNKLVYMAEGACNDCGSLIEWLVNMDFIKSPEDSCTLANSVADTNGVFFVPAFSGLGVPFNDVNAATGFVGIKPTTTKVHLVRSVLESISYRIALCYEALKKERPSDYENLVVDGGVSQNDFICQLVADLTELKVEQLESSTEISLLGAGFVAGLSCGIWESLKVFKKVKKVKKVFEPNGDLKYKEKCKNSLIIWQSAAERLKNWYDHQ